MAKIFQVSALVLAQEHIAPGQYPLHIFSLLSYFYVFLTTHTVLLCLSYICILGQHVLSKSYHCPASHYIYLSIMTCSWPGLRGCNYSAKLEFQDMCGYHCKKVQVEQHGGKDYYQALSVPAGFMFTGAALVSGAGDGEPGMLEGLIIEKLNGWDIEKRYQIDVKM